MPQCKNCQKDFTIYPEDKKFYERISVPEPTWCPDCRRLRRAGWRNERYLFLRKCDFSGQEMVSIFPPNTIFPVYKQDIWFSDKWEPPQADYDPRRPFLEQWHELQLKTPRSGLFNTGGTLVNSDYVSSAARCKDCYMIFSADHNENCYYSNFINYSRDCCDCLTVIGCELSYEILDCKNCYHLYYSTDCDNCRDGYFLYDCVGCSDCYFCTNLRNKKYYFRNKQLTAEQYQVEIKKINFNSRQAVDQLKADWQEFKKQNGICRYFHGIRNINVSGDYISNSKNCSYCFDSDELEDSKFCSRLFDKNKDCYDYDHWGEKSELIYETIASGTHCYNIKFCVNSWENSHDLEYCDHCFICYDCFGCVGLKKGKFCILNKKYPEEDYHQLVEKIKISMKVDGTYGDFFSPKFSPYLFNYSVGADFFNLNQAEAEKLGFKWQVIEKQWQKTDYQIPDDINSISEDILNQILTCQHCGKNYKLIKQELNFYCQQNIPVPRQCFDCRHLARVHSRNPRQLYHRQCMRPGCKNEFETTYAPDRLEKVYCEECYQKEIY
jgi:hypothetical protein